MVLLFGASLLLENLRQLHAVSPGFQVNLLLTASLSLQASTFSKHPSDLIAQLRNRLAPTPGVLALSFVTPLPPTESNRTSTFSRPDRPGYSSLHRINVRLADSNYFAAMGLPLRQGRLFSPEAEAGTAREAIINRTLAERYYPGEDPLGKQIDGLGNPPKPEMLLTLTATSDRGGEVTLARDLSLLLRPPPTPPRPPLPSAPPSVNWTPTSSSPSARWRNPGTSPRPPPVSRPSPLPSSPASRC